MFIQILGDAGDPRTAANACNELMADYIQQDADANLSSLESSYQFVQQRTLAAQSAEKRTGAALQAFRKSNHVVDYTRTASDELGRVSELQNSLRAESINLAVLRARIVADQQQYAQQPICDDLCPAGHQPADRRDAGGTARASSPARERLR